MGRRRATYSAYIRSKTWRAIRMRALKRARNHCQLCASEISLEVHHNVYPRSWGTETRDMLVVLCSRCHRAVHEREKEVVLERQAV